MQFHLAILTYDALADTKRCLASLDAHTTLPYSVHVLDNASRLDTRLWLEERRSRFASLQFSDVNLGVPGGRNALLERVLVTAKDDDIVVFLDNDIEVHAGWHLPFERLFEREPRAGLASKVGWVMRVREDTRDPLTHPWETSRVDIVAGGFACCARVRAIREVGPLDEALGLFWHEDDDWAVRFTRLGWTVWGVPEASMTHHEHASGVAYQTLENGDSVRNLAYLARKWRELGAIDEDGWVRDSDPLFAPPKPVRDAIARALGRRGPLCRGEYAQAYWDLQALQVAERCGRAFPRPVSPCLLALLDVLCDGAAFEMAPAMRARMAELRACLRAEQRCRSLGPVPVPALTAEDGEHSRGAALLRLGAWDDPRWFARFASLRGPDRSDDWFARHGVDWQATTIYDALLEAHAERGPLVVAVEAAESLALGEALGRAGMRIVDGPPAQGLDALVLSLPLVTDADDPLLVENLAAAVGRLAPGAIVAVACSVLVGARGTTSFDPMLGRELPRLGLRVRGAFDRRADGQVFDLLAMSTLRGRSAVVGQRSGPAWTTPAVLFFDLDTTPTHEVPEQACRLVDLRGVDFTRLQASDALRALRAELMALADAGAFDVVVGRGACPPELWPLLAGRSLRYRDAGAKLPRARVVHSFVVDGVSSVGAEALLLAPGAACIEHIEHIEHVVHVGMQCRSTLSWTPCPLRVAREHFGLDETYAIVDASAVESRAGAAVVEAIGAALALLDEQRSSDSHDGLAAQQHIALAAVLVVTSAPIRVPPRVVVTAILADDLRKPLIEGACFVVTAAAQRGLLSYEALDVGVRVVEASELVHSSGHCGLRRFATAENRHD